MIYSQKKYKKEVNSTLEQFKIMENRDTNFCKNTKIKKKKNKYNLKLGKMNCLDKVVSKYEKKWKIKDLK